jgi:hypothetical protein
VGTIVEIEPYIVQLIDQLARMQVPISSRQGLSLANSIVSDTSHEKRVLDWKEKPCFSFFFKNQQGAAMDLGRGY